MRLTLTVNGERHDVEGVAGTESLLYVLRQRLGLHGAKNACEQGQCGSCSVHLDGVLVCACLVPAPQAHGRSVETVEGLAGGDGPHPVQEAFLACGAVQCGFCTPGMLKATEDLLRRCPDPGEAEIKDALAGNLCRCTGYRHILEAVRLAADRTRALEPRP
ncbi:(2Fe-2S)-binding protein [Streptomyces sp. KLMMK]|uniref:(2Fe-2S)-binding protein n=1 Tax=Streptomyces sp. KLMMK TaxID=3109353 RepID=UPI00300A5CF1